jgi:hypothetical protein
MAIENNRQTYDNSSAAPSTQYSVAKILTPTSPSSVDSTLRPVGIRVKVDISVVDSGVASNMCGELLIVVGNYNDQSGVSSIFINTIPQPRNYSVNSADYGIIDPVDEACWTHLVYPDDSNFYDYIKVNVVGNVTDDPSFAEIEILLITPNYGSQVLVETLSWQLI